MNRQWVMSCLLAGALAALAGCSATGPVFQEQAAVASKARVYVYRPASFVNSGNAPNLFVNDVDHGPLWNEGYIPLSLTPGEISVVLKGEPLKWGLPPIGTKARVEAGKTYYFRMGNLLDFARYGTNPDGSPSSTSTVTPVLGRTIEIQQVPASYGRKEIVDTKLAGPGGR